MSALRKEERYTYEDYKIWDDDIRVELINGHIYNMAAPSQNHQILLGELYAEFRNYLKGKPCRVFMAPADVRLDYDNFDNTVVQPDLFVVCDKSKLDGQNCNGAPDLVIEILSPSNSMMDKFIKFNKYLQSGVKEYWIVDPFEKTITVYTLSEDKYIAEVHGKDEEENIEKNLIKVGIFEDLIINTEEIFGEIEES